MEPEDKCSGKGYPCGLPDLPPLHINKPNHRIKQMSYQTGMSSVALRNRVNKLGNFNIHLKNIRVNGNLRGCSGFIENPATGKIVYITTEPSIVHNLSTKVMYRTAKHLKDYTGGQNQWGDLKNNQFITDIIKELNRA